MKLWEVVEDGYFVNIDNITYINCEKEGEFEVGFVGGKSQEFTIDTPKKKFAEAIREQLETIDLEEEDKDIANSEELPKPEPAWRTLLGE